MSTDEKLGPTGVILYDLPSAYIPHKGTGLLHLPRFIAKIKKHLSEEGLPKSYQRNFCKGFDRFLCMHLNIDPEQVIEIVKETGNNEELFEQKLQSILPEDLRVEKWNRELVQKGMSKMGQEALMDAKKKMSIEDRIDLISFADMIDFDEGRIQ